MGDKNIEKIKDSLQISNKMNIIKELYSIGCIEKDDYKKYLKRFIKIAFSMYDGVIIDGEIIKGEANL